VNGSFDKLRKLLSESEKHKWTIQEVWEVIGVSWDADDEPLLTLDDAEKLALLRGLDATCSQKEAAVILGISESALIYKMKKHRIWNESDNKSYIGK